MLIGFNENALDYGVCVRDFNIGGIKDMPIEELRVIRKEAGLSLEEVSAIGVTRQTLAGIEKGEVDVALSVLRKLAAKYGYDLRVYLERRLESRTLQVDLLEVEDGISVEVSE